MKTTMQVRVPVEDWKELERRGERSELVRQGIKTCVEHPEVLGEVVKALASAPSGQPQQEEIIQPSSLLIEPVYVAALDTLAKKIMSTRQALVQLIIKGILGGVVR